MNKKNVYLLARTCKKQISLFRTTAYEQNKTLDDASHEHGWGVGHARTDSPERTDCLRDACIRFSEDRHGQGGEGFCRSSCVPFPR